MFKYFLFCLIVLINHKYCIVFVTVGVGPASIMVGNLVAGKRIAQATGRELGIIEDQDMSRKVCRLYLNQVTSVLTRVDLHETPNICLFNCM